MDTGKPRARSLAAAGFLLCEAVLFAVADDTEARAATRVGFSHRPALHATRHPLTPGMTAIDAGVRPAAARSHKRAHVRKVIIRTARRRHVGTRLAQAIAWQESGWDQGKISRAGAIGVMQVMPATGRWASRLAGRRLNLHNLDDNVLAGVVVLRRLQAVLPREQAIAAYYQGIGSLRRHGMYPSTRRYVRNVLALRERMSPR